jgi:hypothetical protein
MKWGLFPNIKVPSLLAILLEVNPETGVALWSPSSIVFPLLQVAAVALSAALAFYVLVLALPILLRFAIRLEGLRFSRRIFGRARHD